jgi:hypothetical protein
MKILMLKVMVVAEAETNQGMNLLMVDLIPRKRAVAKR